MTSGVPASGVLASGVPASGAPADAPSAPRWDRNRVLFEIDADGQTVSCAVSREALQDVSDRRYAKPAELLMCFSKVQRRLERIALAKFRSRADLGDGLILIWSGDFDEPTPAT